MHEPKGALKETKSNICEYSERTFTLQKILFWLMPDSFT